MDTGTTAGVGGYVVETSGLVNGTTGSTPYIPAGGWVAVIGGTIVLGMAGTCCRS
jgi:hypothetical protein